MKKMWMFIILVAIVAVSLGLQGCHNQDNAVVTEAAESRQEGTNPAENPAAAKPKDHPAH